MMLVVICLVAYLLGSIPFGLIVGHLWAKIDIRKYGSGNIGMTNVLRTLGYMPGLLTLVLDGGKELQPSSWPSWSQMIRWCGCLRCVAIVGHNWSIFLRFQGGKGVATTRGYS